MNDNVNCRDRYKIYYVRYTEGTKSHVGIHLAIEKRREDGGAKSC